MENQNLTPEENQPVSHLTITSTAINYLRETGKWTNFLAVISFIFIGLIVLMGIFAGSMMSYFSKGQMDNMPNGMGFLFGGMYIFMGVLYFFPAWYLLNFSHKIKLAISTNSKSDLDAAFSSQKSFFKFWGILTIIITSIYVFFGLIALLINF